MSDHAQEVGLITSTSLTEFFHETVNDAIDRQRVAASESTVHYVVNLLTEFSRSDRLFDRTEEGVMLRPLASIYADAVEEPTADARRAALRRLGDVALFVAGAFADSLNRKLVDVDYYIAMGGGAYAGVSDALRGTIRGEALCTVFDELAEKFTSFVDVLGEVCDASAGERDVDLMRAYEIWVRTGSRRARRQLIDAGIHPLETASPLTAH